MVNTFENHKELEKTYRVLLDKPTFQFPERGKSFLDIAGFPHREKVWSNFYAFFLDQKQEHGLGKLFLSCLIDILVEKTSNEFEPDFFQEFDVELEYPIPNVS
jgi:hypothetical protein